jgi:ppGpp synthetase/RelA/SpoT-type nucleotidyltranferase
MKIYPISLNLGMAELKREYEEKLHEVAENVKTSEIVVNSTEDSKDETKITDRIKSIKDILIGGERANDTQLKEKRFKKKLQAQKKLK